MVVLELSKSETGLLLSILENQVAQYNVMVKHSTGHERVELLINLGQTKALYKAIARQQPNYDAVV